MFSPRPKSVLNNSVSNSPICTPNRTSARRNSSLYVSRNKSFFTPQNAGRNKTQNASELPLALNAEHLSDYKLSIFEGFIPTAVSKLLSNFEGLPPKAKINSDGTAWIVLRDKLFIWNISLNKQSNACHELHLANMAATEDGADDLIFVATLETEDSDSISCLAITSEGSAIYWNCIAYPRSFVEMKISSGRGPSDLCVDMTVIADGFLVGWLSGTLTFLQPSQGQLKQTTLRAQQGRLTNIGRRFSNMIFGSGERSSSAMNIGSLRRLLLGDEVGVSGWELFVLLETQLQKWIISSPPLSEKMLYEVNLDVLISEALDQFLGMQPESVVLQDIQLTRNGLSVLFAAISCSSAKYGIAFLATSTMEAPTSVTKVLMSDVECPLLNDGEAKNYKLLWPDRSSSTDCFFYNSESISCFKDNEDDGVACEVVNFSNLAAGCYQGLAIFLSAQSVLVKIQETVVAANRSVADSLLRNKTFSNLDTSVDMATNRLNELCRSGDPLMRFKAIFISSMCNAPSNVQHNKTASMLSDLVTSDRDGVDFGRLDSLVVGLSREMTDDCPSNDPRWTESRSSEISVVSSSLILSHQLNDKLKAQEAYLVFLKNNGIWNRLGTFLQKEGCAPTSRILCEHSEKIVAATALKDAHSDWPKLIDSAIEKCISQRGLSASQGSLKSQDVFYREISRVQDIFEPLVAVERDYLDTVNVEMNPDAVKFVGGVTSVIRDVLGKSLLFRRSKAEFYKNAGAQETRTTSSPYRAASPWTASDVVLRPLIKQHAILSTEIIPMVPDEGRLNALFQDLLDITDLILDGLTTVLDLVGDSDRQEKKELLKKYEQTRSDLFGPFVQYKQNERVMSLAEKYCDYELLIRICDSLQDEARLEEYMTRFDDKGFPEVVFNWYCKTGSRGKLFTPGMMRHPRLEEFLRRPENQFMSWIFDVRTRNFASAHETLLDLAVAEKDSVTKKRTLLSSAKLYALMSKDPPFDVNERIQIINNNLDLISHQELLFQNQSVLEYLAISNFSSSRVYTPLELIDLHVGPCNSEADEFEFKKGFDILKFCNTNDDEHPIRDILVDIWVKAITRDDWEFRLSTTDPISSCRDTVFFKFLELVLSEVSDIDAVLPSIDELLESESLEHKQDDVDFRCKLMVIYEHARGMTM